MVDRRMMLRFFGTGVVLVAFSPLPYASSQCIEQINTYTKDIVPPATGIDYVVHTFGSAKIDDIVPCCKCKTDFSGDTTATIVMAYSHTSTATQTAEVDLGLALLFKLLSGWGIKDSWVKNNTTSETLTATIAGQTLHCSQRYMAFIDSQDEYKTEKEFAGSKPLNSAVTRTKFEHTVGVRASGTIDPNQTFDPCYHIVSLVDPGLTPPLCDLAWGGWLPGK